MRFSGVKRPSKHKIGFEALERRVVLNGNTTSPLNQITALYGSGFTPTDLQLNGSATLSESLLRLTDGGRNEAASAYHTKPVKISDGFTTSFEFQFAPNGVDPLGSGFAFVIQNGSGVGALNNSYLDQLGIPITPHFAVKFSTYCPGYLTNDPNNTYGRSFSDNATGLYTGFQKPDFSDASEIHIPKNLIDFHSGHKFRATLEYTAPMSSRPGSLNETITDMTTTMSWSHLYANLDLQSIFKRQDVDGELAYAGFTASTGGPTPPPNMTYTFGKGAATQDIMDWSWQGGESFGNLPYEAAFEVSRATVTSGAVLDGDGNLIRTLWQDTRLTPGSYTASWDGLDNLGSLPAIAMHPGPYTIKVALGTISVRAHTIANNTADPSNPAASISSIWMNGVTVAPDGSTIWASVTNGDTAGGGFVKVFDGNGRVDTARSQYFGFQQIGEAVAFDSRSLYVLSEVQGWSGEFGIFRVDRATGIPSNFSSNGIMNQDGSEVRSLTDSINYLSILRGEVGYHLLPAIAVGNSEYGEDGILWVSDITHDLVHRYDKLSGRQIGVPLSIPHPTGITVDSAGNLWVAHGSSGEHFANLISIYDANGNFLRDASEITNLKDVISLQILDGKLVVADNGSGRVLIYSVAGTSVSDPNPSLIIGRPANFGDDDGINTFWNLRGAAIDALGNVYTAQITASPSGDNGTQLEKWSSSGEFLWSSGGYEYQSIPGMYTHSDPTTVISSSLHRYRVDPASGAWSYTGSVAYPGFDGNKWSGLPSTSPPSPLKVVRIQGQDFFVIPTAPGNRLIFYRLADNGAFHPSTIVGASGLSSGNAWTWVDSRGDGVPLDSDILDSQKNVGQIIHMTVDQEGNIFFQYRYDALYELPLRGVDPKGNPIYDWNHVSRVASVPNGMQSFIVGDDGIYAIYYDALMGPKSSDSAYADFSVGGANALCKFDSSGNVLWTIPLSKIATSLDRIPGGGVIVGNLDTTLAMVAKDGSTLFEIQTSTPGDVLDFGGGTIVVNRNPIDGLVDVFAEGLGYSDTSWYRIDDQTAGSRELRGTLRRGDRVTLTVADAGVADSAPNPLNAAFVNSESNGDGSAQYNHGADGTLLAGGTPAPPAYVDVSIQGASPWTWAADTTDPRALLNNANGSRSASCWYSGSSITIDLNFKDPKAHPVTLYAVDWDSFDRSQRIDVVDPVTGVVLDSRTMGDYHDGRFLSWMLRGHVQMRITPLTGNNAIVGGLFFGGQTNPDIEAKYAGSVSGDASRSPSQADGTLLAGGTPAPPAYVDVSIQGASPWTWAADTTDPRALLNNANGSRSASCWYSGSSITIDLNFKDPKAHPVTLYAVDWDSFDRSQRIDVVDPVTGVVLDSRTMGDYHDGRFLSWMLRGHVQMRITPLTGNNAIVGGLFFGGQTNPDIEAKYAGSVSGDASRSPSQADGTLLAGGTPAPPAYVDVSIQGASPWTWAADTTDPRALLNNANGSRSASCWYSGSSITIDLNFKDPKAHPVTLYAVDWDSFDRSQRIDVVDPVTGVVLDSRTMGDYHDGRFLSWMLRGHVQMRITPLTGNNAIVGGLFFGGQTNPDIEAKYAGRDAVELRAALVSEPSPNSVRSVTAGQTASTELSIDPTTNEAPNGVEIVSRRGVVKQASHGHHKKGKLHVPLGPLSHRSDSTGRLGRERGTTQVSRHTGEKHPSHVNRQKSKTTGYARFTWTS